MRRAGRANQLRRGAAQAHRRLPPAERHLQGAAPNAGLCHTSAGRSPPEIGPGRLHILVTSPGVTGCLLPVVRAARRAAAGVAWGRVASAGGGGLRRGGVSAALRHPTRCPRGNDLMCNCLAGSFLWGCRWTRSRRRCKPRPAGPPSPPLPYTAPPPPIPPIPSPCAEPHTHVPFSPVAVWRKR